MNTIGNLIWLIFGGFFSALGYFVVGFMFCITIIGIPFGLQCFKIGMLTLLPFGKQVVTTPSSGGCLTLLFNLIWIVTGGLYTAFMHLIFALLLFITVIGIPFGRQHLKLLELTLTPFGKKVVDK
ncbi:MAG TPA: YccF domain-containing protein [Parafilimonas sp.]|nr:YccF domain-containing protein [Parafilimonas sp.]